MRRRVVRAGKKNPPVRGRQSRSELDDLYIALYNCVLSMHGSFFVVTKFHIADQSTQSTFKTC